VLRELRECHVDRELRFVLHAVPIARKRQRDVRWRIVRLCVRRRLPACCEHMHRNRRAASDRTVVHQHRHVSPTGIAVGARGRD
jgi:hypothetical protein